MRLNTRTDQEMSPTPNMDKNRRTRKKEEMKSSNNRQSSREKNEKKMERKREKKKLPIHWLQNMALSSVPTAICHFVSNSITNFM